VDASLESGQVITTSYDPMLGKIIIHGPDRESARRQLTRALGDTVILGLTTNLSFLHRLTDSREFRECEIDTGWLDRHPDALRASDEPLAWFAAGWLATLPLAASHDAFAAADGWRLGARPAPSVVLLELGGERRELVVDHGAGTISYAGDSMRVRTLHRAETQLSDVALEIGGKRITVAASIAADGVEFAYHGRRFVFTRPDRRAPVSGAAPDDQVVAPMPGLVNAVHVAVGQAVTTGDALGAIEAMKMEYVLRAALPGMVTAVEVTVGQQVQFQQVLFVVEASAGGTDRRL
jgi:3-methylcrotonyl-CoA carboxylase alpha subunit/acetyl-CoA/propionyl-CoA carboxylase biotin carboxyl carrier protein